MVCRLVRDPCFVGIIEGRPKHSIYILGSQNTLLIHLYPQLRRPKHSIYILGSQNTLLIHLYPHFTQSVLRNVVDSEEFSVKKWHSLVPRDPSCAVGFSCRSPGDLSDLLERLPQTLSIHTAKKTTNPVMESLIEIKDDDG
ncbi:hypothetical protein T265_03363 [Opisthorchis viverrini]|uniref:Cysteine protease n=1 Tax=Opisthorchis viverrini TaxID=6198 RepID=A0A074ZSZ3_OPIVI|nr:hypothetical protein T265_03363 [Opisthorchis viverrini]KER30211.1 hypothetical protein T265_03363 [Opisthorchis viverrini]